uniref:Uncharacterized protein n=1 Tax=Arundo donax TaxID=35708 RepID=A0A0A8YJL4_ARUDO
MRCKKGTRTSFQGRGGSYCGRLEGVAAGE